jgi:Uma2 family endonuclease
MIARKPYRITVDRYDKMIAAGILTENDPVELIRGEIVTKMPIGSYHAACVNRINEYLIRNLGVRATIGIQNPIVLADSEPEPDVTVLKRRSDYYADDKPAAEDVLLVIEVADSSLDFDRDEKLAIYAEAGIGEYWIVNLLDSVIEVYRDPAGSEYRSRRVVAPSEIVSLLHLPDVAIDAADVLPSPSPES